MTAPIFRVDPRLAPLPAAVPVQQARYLVGLRLTIIVSRSRCGGLKNRAVPSQAEQ